jgi:hypothetical protein
MVTDTGQNVASARKTWGIPHAAEKGGWGGRSKSGENPEKTRFAVVNTPSNDADFDANEWQTIANRVSPDELRRESG